MIRAVMLPSIRQHAPFFDPVDRFGRQPLGSVPDWTNLHGVDVNDSNARVRLRTGGAWLTLAVALGPSAVTAQDQTAVDCAAIESAEQRLACFDAAYGKSETLPEQIETSSGAATDSPPGDAGPAAAAGAAAATATTTPPDEADFGLSKSKTETEGESLVSGIAAVSKDGYDKLIFELENGQVWRQLEYKRFIVKAGDVAEIRHGSFGSYKLYIQGKKTWTRVRRAQ